ncbi:DUF6443 domain-containing protein [Algoriphagus sp. Y33]|uniref:DUF6443 domain-containing protein n=1 Tax=Algoriphagus sp. Y33 TaxID=2772483 RepID=UPI00178533B5|nr:DUF6443 domain-containing protein [Algoriphagus sp. Y33]
MRKAYITSLLIWISLGAWSQNLPNTTSSSTASSPQTLTIPSIPSSANLNVVREYFFNVPVLLLLGSPTKEQAQIKTSYFDGLGRPIQDVYYQLSPTGKDLVKPYVFDTFKREKYGLGIYPSTTATGKINLTPGTAYTSRLSTIYTSEGNYFTRIQYENSPNNKVIKTSAPGNSWSGSNKGVSVSERLNASNENIRRFELVAGQTESTYLGLYPSNELVVERTVDEDGKISEIFTNFLGQKILSRVATVSNPGTGFSDWLWTYFIYDHKGRLAYSLLPEGARLCNNAGNWNIESSTVAGHYFKYFYDSRDRIYQKKIPGAGIEEYVYDHLGRTVMLRNGQHKTAGEWMVYKYNDFDQIGTVGRVYSSTARSSYQASVDSNMDYIKNLTLNSTDQSNIYGSYSFGGTLQTFNTSFNSNFGTVPKPSKAIHGKLTGKRSKIDGTGSYLTEAYFYDDRGNLIQKKAINHQGGTDWTTMEYDFAGNLIKSYHVQNNPSAGTHSVINLLKTYSYDHANRLVSITQKVNSQPVQTIATYTYDELGQLITKNWNGLQTVNYRYNPRGWLTHINDANLSQSGDTFGMQIFYDFGYSSSNLNGNVSGIQWKSSRDNVKRNYGFNYDRVNRLTRAHYVAYGTAWNLESDRYSLSSISYDRNGNILALNRRGKTANPNTFGVIDQLAYTYSGNRLTKIEDIISSTLGFNDFKNGSNTTTEYEYNNAGSLTKDLNKGITSITYNFNNLPRVIQFGSASNQITNVYDAEGKKLYTTVVTNGVSKTTHYIGDFIYEGNTIQSFSHEEGRTAWNSTSGNFMDEYFHKDHLGNIRQVIRAPVTDGFIATMEESVSEQEEREYSQLPETRILDHRHNKTPGGNQVAWLNADRGRLLGPARVQETQEGDSLNLAVDVIFDRKNKGGLFPFVALKDGTAPQFSNQLLESVESLSHAQQISPLLALNIAGLILRDIDNRKTPESYLMYALYDQDSVLYEQGKVMVSNSAANEHEQLRKSLYVSKNGYLETFVVNETDQNIYFDNLMVQSTSPIIVQENQYYPFGMTIAGLDYSYENNSNRYLYNGKERQSDLGLNLYDYGARMYDPAIGRWSVVDPMADSYQAYSPYNYTLNNPIKFTDPNGMWVDGPNGGFFTDDPREISDFMGSQQRNEGNDKTYEGGTLPEHSVNAPRAFDGVLGRAADKWRDNNLGYSTYGKRASEGLGYQTQWSQDFKVFVGVGYGMINNMLFASLGTLGYLDDAYGTYSAAKGVLNTSEIHFMQSSIKNTTGNFTVLGNAEALANGSLNPNVLRMNVWKDASGKVWTLDHRRLGAFKLSGLEQAPIQWANPSSQMWKMTTTNGGTSIKLKLGGGNSMIIK